MTHQLPQPVDAIPTSLIDVAETLGLPVALKLMAHFGGQELRFPKRPSTNHPIIKALGETDGLAVCQFLADEKIYIPHARAARLTRVEIAKLEAEGKDRNEISRILGISVRHVRRVANLRQRRDDRQLDLFSDD